jgi:hypothetical protein
VRFQKLMWRNMMMSTKSQKVSILYYSIDNVVCACVFLSSTQNLNVDVTKQASYSLLSFQNFVTFLKVQSLTCYFKNLGI